MRTAIYVRVAAPKSTGQSLIEKPLIEQQVDRLREHLIARGEVPRDEDVFRDEGRSGGTLDRPALNQLRARVRRGTYERVLVASLDRLSRDITQFKTLINEFKRRGCQVEILDYPNTDILIELSLLYK